MTLLDRAFIKAYAETGASHPAREHRVERTTPPPRAAAHVAAFDAPRGVRVAKETLPPAIERPRAGQSAPLTPLSAFAPPPRPHESFRPLLEVDHLSWPEACDALLARVGADWERFADRLSRQIAAGQKCIALTSCQRGEGRSSVALATAKLMAGRGLRSVVVDADFEHPTLADSCGISPQAGWGEVSSGELSLGEALIGAVDDRVSLLPWRGSHIRTGEWTNTLAVATSFSMLRDHYDLVLLDTMPLDKPAAISEFASLAEAIRLDATYLVFDARSTSSGSVTHTCATLRHLGLRVDGLIENFGSTATRVEMAQTESLPSVLIPAKRDIRQTD